MLQTIRDYARELLENDHAVDLAVGARHAQHFLEVVEQAMPLGADVDTLAVQRDYENVLTALRFWLGVGRDESGASTKSLRLAASMGHYWFLNGQAPEGIALLTRALEVEDRVPVETKSRALLALGYLCGLQEEVDRASKAFSEAEVLCRQAEDRIGEGHCLNGLGLLALNARQYAEADTRFLAAVHVAQDSSDTPGLKGFRNNLGLVYLTRGDWHKAREIFLENLAQTSHSDDVLAAVTRLNLGVAHIIGARPQDAVPFLREASKLFATLEDPNGVIETMEATVGLALADDHWTEAARLVGGTEAARERLGRFGAPVDRVHLEKWAGLVEAKLGPKGFDAARHEGAAMTYGQLREYAHAQLSRAGEA